MFRSFNHIFKNILILSVFIKRIMIYARQLDGELFLAPGFSVPSNSDYVGYHNYIDETLPPESPQLYGLHSNAEIEFLTTQSENLFKTVLEMQPKDAGAGTGSGPTREVKVTNSMRPWIFMC
jgi:dynein heavy chain